MFRIPESLAELGRERIQGFPVEGFIYGEGPQKPRLMLIGEAPGEFELVDGIPFIGRAGKELMKSLASIGLTRDDVYITSAVRSRPYRWGTKKERDGTTTERKYNRPPTRKEIIAHAPVLDYEIANLEPKFIITLGNVGLQRLVGKEAKVTELHGQVLRRPIQYLENLEDTTFSWTDEEYTIVPTFHPASVFYRPSHRPSLEADWLKIGELLKGVE
ncbi:uracil-DNA glycosylase [Sporosarcina pasteurii]|uniref:Uracil-DNA glycosylase, family 4 n=1 Tax=Sporosarcina pasteurii TaxID=1474 RepID=A0A380CHP2_SPOPA|nr:uracil-DNA glycosylase [Sporosarcina pasteurii]MDS9472119.1 uracil-DNA glycosylase [Sporosarcina pasteurii]QBQ06834.1 uracil-DNA glycosylase [Sporosarcina pasteurii]SUJ20736.1 uracil-DNA glycosylase, family 4 [Sporosarcina pasteurii]